MKKKKILTSVAASAIAITSVIGMGASAFADGAGNSSVKSGKAPTAEQIAEHQAQRAEKLDERLTQSVADGAITEDQKTAILEFFDANKPVVDSSATHDERKAAMDAFKLKVEAFAQANGINIDLLKPEGRPNGPGGENRTPPTAEDRAAHLEERLSEAVSDGTISESQKAEIIAFITDNAPGKPSSDTTFEERKAAMDEFKTQVEEFATANDIDIDLLKPKGPAGHGGPRGHGGANSNS